MLLIENGKKQAKSIQSKEQDPTLNAMCLGTFIPREFYFFNYLKRFLYYQNLRYIENEFKVFKQT